jgi:glyoxylase-like metal-dependent hydrolase (beta-lactamase superfamily II)
MPLHFDGDIRITKIPEMGPISNNGYIVVCPETNEGIIIDTPAEPEKLLNAIGDVKITSILITHKHGDHTAGFDTISGGVGAPVGIGTEDIDGLPRQPELDLKDGDVVKFGNRELQVLATPGHTEGGRCFLYGKHLFSGDTLFPGGPGKSDNPNAFREIIDSITSKLLTLPDDTTVYPGHGLDTTIGDTRREHQEFASKPHAPDLFGDVTWLGK